MDINWGSIADWASAVGSLSASVTALYLARSADRIDLRGFLGVRTVLAQAAYEPEFEIATVRATNMGRRGTTVTTLAWRTGFGRTKRYAVVLKWDERISDRVPKLLNDGESGMWSVELKERDAWLRDLCTGQEPYLRNRWDVLTLRFEIQTSNGGRLVLRPEKPLRQRIEAAFAASKLSGPA